MYKRILAGLFLTLASNSYAGVIDFTAEGTDNIANSNTPDCGHSAFAKCVEANYFTVDFSGGGATEFIQSVEFNLRAGGQLDAYFDPDGSDGITAENTSGGKGFGPIIGDKTTGILRENIHFSLDAGSFTLTIKFDSGVFGKGDVFSFGIDLDGFDEGNENIYGGLLGDHSVGIKAVLSDGCTETAETAFEREVRNRSVASLALCEPTPIPSPSILWLLLAGVVPFRLISSRRTRVITLA